MARHRLRQLAQGVDLSQLFLDCDLGPQIVALAEVEPGGHNPPLSPEEEAGPALAPVGMPEVACGVYRDRELDPDARQAGRDGLAIGAEGEAWGLRAEHTQARVAVAALPLDQVGKRPDAIELGEVEEVDQRRPPRRQRRHRLRLDPDPLDARRKVGRGECVAFRAHSPDVILSRLARIVATGEQLGSRPSLARRGVRCRSRRVAESF